MDEARLRWWRRGAVLGLVVLAGLPLLAPFGDLLRWPQAWAVYAESDRLADLALSTLALMVGAIAVALPLGAALGVLLFRTDLPGARPWRYLLLGALFLPLPLLAGGWQMAGQVFQAGALLEGATAQRLLLAILLHGIISLPWVMLISGLGFLWVEPELEEDALLAAPPWIVFLHVTLPRSRAALSLAALYVALFCATEITLTDLWRVRTYGEEVYTQLVAGNDTEVARAVAACLPLLVVLLPTTVLLLYRWRRTCPTRLHLQRPARIFPLGRWRWPATLFVALCTVLVLAAPIGGLFWKAGLRYATAAHPGPPTWETSLLLERFLTQWRNQADLLAQSLALAAATGVLAAGGALVLSWLVRSQPRWENGLWSLAAALWAMPGPLLGLGLLTYWQVLFALPGGEWLKLVLWSQPSPVPNLWVGLLRFGPVALALLWPLVRQIPLEMEACALLDGARPWQRFRLVYWASLWQPALWTAVAIGTLSLGEISAGKLVTTPGYLPLAHHVFQQMHAGADTELAALCLVLLTAVALGGLLVALWQPWRRLDP